MLRSAIERIARKAGFTFVPDWRVVHLEGERTLRKLLKYLAVDCVFDVGANEGQYAKSLRDDIGFEGRIISFEPNPKTFETLLRNSAKDPLWQCENFALGDGDGSIEFNAYDESSLASVRRLKSTEHIAKPMSGSTITVPMKSLVTYLKESREAFDFHRPFLKMDTQGYDLEVAMGAAECLREFVGLQSEIAFKTLYEGAPDYVTALNYYKAAGFDICRLIPIHDIFFPRLVEMDAIMVRRDLGGA